MKYKRSLYIAIIILAVCILAFIVLNASLRSATYEPSEYRETDLYLDNPYIGWYQINFYQLSDVISLDISNIDELPYGPALLLLEIDLQNYQDSPLSEEALDQFNSLLSVCQLKGKQLIIRFMYGSEGNAIEYEPKDIAIVKMHMSQTAEIINQYTDCVYIIQGLFIGAWGEMHSSQYTDWDSILTLAGHLNAVTDPSIFLAVRTPEQWRTITQSSAPLALTEAFSGSLASRLSLFNDGILGSESDLGTYETTAISTIDVQYPGKLGRQAETLFQNKLCNYVPNGGEVVIDNPLNDFFSAIEYLNEIHISYLNSMYDQSVLNKWAASLYEEENPYKGLSGYDYIGSHMGYRFVVRRSTFEIASIWEEIAEYSVQIENVGFSNSYRPFDVSLLLKNAVTDEEILIPLESDTRFWATTQAVTLNIPLKIRDYPLGTYNMFIRMHDPVTQCDVYFANEGSHTSSGLLLGTLDIQPMW